MEKNDPKGKIVDLMRSASPSHDQVPHGVKINGDGNIVGSGNTVIKTEKHVTKTIAKPSPGSEHITEEQVGRLHKLKDEIIRLESMAKKDPATPGRVWGAVNRICGVGAMRMIPVQKFKKAENYMLQWIGRLTDTKSVKNKDPEGVRNKRIAYIKLNSKDPEIKKAVSTYMLDRFNANSLKDLDLPDLERVYRYVASKKRSFKA
jgi:hypothetical protein